MELVHSELLKLVMQAADPHLGLQLRKKGNQEVVKKKKQQKNSEKETDIGSEETLQRKNKKAFSLLFCS